NCLGNMRQWGVEMSKVQSSKFRLRPEASARQAKVEWPGMPAGAEVWGGGVRIALSQRTEDGTNGSDGTYGTHGQWSVTDRLKAGLLTLMVFVTSFTAVQARAAGGAERRMFEEARKAFHDGFWQRAEAGFADFAKRYPGSERFAEAVLLEA